MSSNTISNADALEETLELKEQRKREETIERREETRNLEETRRSLETPTPATGGEESTMSIEDVEDDLLVDPDEFDSAADVREAYSSGEIPDEDLDRILEAVVENESDDESALLDVANAASDERPEVYRMMADRRVGTLALQVDGENVRFGKPSGRASTELLDPLAEMERENAPASALGTYVWNTLEEWSLDADLDADHWADELALLDALQTARALALGGNARLG